MTIGNNALLKDSTIIFVASMIGNGFNYLFHLYMGRALGPADYGILASLISILYILLVPSSTIATTLSKFVSKFKSKGEYDKISSIMFSYLKKLLVLGFFGAIVIFLGSDVIASFLNIPDRTPVLILGLVFMTSLLLPILMGTLQGLQKFKSYGMTNVLNFGSKLVFGVALVYLGLGVNGAVLAFLFSTLFAFFIAFIFLRFLIHKKKVVVEKTRKYSSRVLIALVGMVMLINIDLILVKHFFSSNDAGYYAAASMLGKMIFFASGTVIAVMFPKVSELYSKGKNTSPLLKEALFYSFAISLAGVIIYFVSPYFVVTTLYGSQYIPSVGLLGLFGVAMALFSLSNVLVMYNLAINRMKFIYVLVIFLISEIVLISFIHSSLIDVLKILTVINALFFTSLLTLNKKELMK